MNKLRFEELLERDGKLTYTNVGTSMLPLLQQGRDLFTVEKKGPGRCMVGDVVLYRRHPDIYVLHRIVEVRPHDYVLLGDNCIERECGVTDNDILGVMTSFVRKGEEHRVDEPAYRAYTAFIINSAPLRIVGKRILGKAKRLLHEI